MRIARLLPALLLAGCAATTPSAQVVPLGTCRIPNFSFPSAQRDFDRERSVRLLGEVEKTALADRQALSEGAAEARLGRGLEGFGADGGGSKFVAHDVAELATRLRQLDCAILAGGLKTPGEADRRYERLLAEIEAARHALGVAAR